jgi:DNA-binding NarL/FixJ family response regulator
VTAPDIPPLHVLVVDGQRTFADAVARRLDAEDGLTVVAVVPSPESAWRAMARRDVHVMLVDADQPDDAAVSLCADVSGREHPPPVVMLSASAETERIVAAIRAGAVGWVRKTETMEYLLRVIRGVTRGETWMPPSELGRIFRLLLHEQHPPDDVVLAPLTARERQVLSHMADGAGRLQIAQRMQLSPHTVRSHMQSLMRKLGAHSALEAVAMVDPRALSSGGQKAKGLSPAVPLVPRCARA